MTQDLFFHVRPNFGHTPLGTSRGTIFIHIQTYTRKNTSKCWSLAGSFQCTSRYIDHYSFDIFSYVSIVIQHVCYKFIITHEPGLVVATKRNKLGTDNLELLMFLRTV